MHKIFWQIPYVISQFHLYYKLAKQSKISQIQDNFTDSWLHWSKLQRHSPDLHRKFLAMCECGMQVKWATMED